MFKVLSEETCLDQIDGLPLSKGPGLVTSWSRDEDRLDDLRFQDAPPRSAVPDCKPPCEGCVRWTAGCTECQAQPGFCGRCQTCRQKNASNPLKPEERFTADQHKVRQQFVNTKVYTKYNNMAYIVDEVRFDMTPQDAFDCKGQQKGYAEYLREKYNIQEELNPNQPMFQARPTGMRSFGKPPLLVPQVCIVSRTNSQSGVTLNCPVHLRAVSIFVGRARISRPRSRASCRVCAP